MKQSDTNNEKKLAVNVEQHKPETEKAVDQSLALVAKRPPKGKAGTKVDVITNSFVVSTPLEQIHLYLTEFTPEIPEDASEQRQKVINNKFIRDQILASHGTFFFENKHLLCLRLKEGEKQFTNKELTQTVTIKYLKSIDLKDLSPSRIEQHEQITHLMINKVIRKADLIRIGANFFERNDPLFSGAGKYDIHVRDCPDIRIWRGYSISCERKTGGIHMNVDSVHRVLHQKSVGEKMKELLKEYSNNPKLARQKIEEMVVDNVVLTIYNRRLYRVTEVDWNLGIDDTFDKDGKPISFRDYFKNIYNETCEQKFKGMLVHIPKRRKNSTGAERIILAPELCHETGLSKKLKSNFTLMKKIADTTRIPAKKRHELRTKLVKRLQNSIMLENSYDTDSVEGSQKGKNMAETSSSPTREPVSAMDAVSSESQIPIILSKKPVQVEARLLPKFSVSVADQTNEIHKVDPYTELQNAWNNAKFINKSIYKIRKWVVLSEDPRTADMCVNQIRNVGKNANLLNNYINPNPVRYSVQRTSGYGKRNNSNNWRKAIQKAIEEVNPNIILCVLPDDRSGNPTAVYNMVKTMCCTEIPVLTQCITTRNIMNQKRANSVFKGCLKQMLIKMGNTPWRANLSVPDKSINLNKPTMICGMDVNHDARRNCSTVSFVASYTSDYTKYNTFVYHQKSGREVMIEGGQVMGDALKEFHKCNKTLPANIIVYRDGVSTAQLPVIVLHEVRSYKERFAKIKVEGKPYSPKLTVVVTQKNVSARFIDLHFNSLMPGTVIDSQVVSSKFWDFYLIPCAATNRSTTASPTRFIVAYDDIKVTQDDISALTNQLCNIYFNIATPVRVPAPNQYAHKIAHMFGTAIENKELCKELTGKPFFL